MPGAAIPRGACRINRPRLAPRAPRTANSCVRAVPRANSRMDTFAHASRSSNIDAAKIRTRVGTNLAALSPSTRLRTSGRTSLRKASRRFLGELVEERLKSLFGHAWSDTPLETGPDGPCTVADGCKGRIELQIKRNENLRTSWQSIDVAARQSRCTTRGLSRGSAPVPQAARRSVAARTDR